MIQQLSYSLLLYISISTEREILRKENDRVTHSDSLKVIIAGVFEVVAASPVAVVLSRGEGDVSELRLQMSGVNHQRLAVSFENVLKKVEMTVRDPVHLVVLKMYFVELLHKLGCTFGVFSPFHRLRQLYQL